MSDNRFLLNDEEESQIDLTPMLDVVFIMLIFFIVTSTFVKESGVDVTRPEAETAVVTESNSIQIGISAANQIFMDKRQIDKRAIRAMQRWKFRPKIVNGKPEAQRARQTIEFKLGQ